MRSELSAHSRAMVSPARSLMPPWRACRSFPCGRRRGRLLGGVAARVLPLLWLGGVISGAGFGASFSGALRAITPLVEMHQRAGLFAAVYLVAYLSFGVPAIIAGLLVAPAGLLATVLGYGVAIILAASAGLAAQIRNTQN